LIKKLINLEDSNGDTVLHLASFHSDFRIVNRLLEFGADKTLANLEGKLPIDLAQDDFVRRVLTNLNKAAKNSDEKNVVELVNSGHDINSKTSIFSQAPLHKVIESKKEDKYQVLKKMLDMGADPNIKDSNGWTALHYACEFGDLESVKILVNNKIIIDSYSNNSRTPLHLASIHNSPSIVKFLLENMSDPNFKDHSGCTPLLLAAKYGNVDCMALLLAYGANLYEEDFRKWNILHYAAFQGHPKAVRYICKYDSDFDFLQNKRNSQQKLAIEIARDSSIKSCFITIWHAARQGDLDATRHLLFQGENINELSTFLKNTPLHLAVFNNHYLLVRLLLENKAEADIRNRDGVTPLEYADMLFTIISKLYNRLGEDSFSQEVDLRDFVRNALNKSEKILNSTVCKANRKVKLWNVLDFSSKITKILSTGFSSTGGSFGRGSQAQGFGDSKNNFEEKK